MRKLPILCYHHIGPVAADVKHPRLYVDPSNFERQLATLHRLGFRGVSLTEGLMSLDRDGERLCAITFDDGYTDTLTLAAPLLAKYGFSASCFVVSDRIGRTNEWDRDRYAREQRSLMNLAQVRSWIEAGFEIGSHSRSHRPLSELTPTEARDEIAGSRARLEELTGTRPDHFCYPFGNMNAATRALVREAGFASSVSTVAGIARSSDDRFALPRILVRGDRGIWDFLRRLVLP